MLNSFQPMFRIHSDWRNIDDFSVYIFFSIQAKLQDEDLNPSSLSRNFISFFSCPPQKKLRKRSFVEMVDRLIAYSAQYLETALKATFHQQNQPTKNFSTVLTNETPNIKSIIRYSLKGLKRLLQFSTQKPVLVEFLKNHFKIAHKPAIDIHQLQLKHQNLYCWCKHKTLRYLKRKIGMLIISIGNL